jgi:hypothetical protein
MFKLFKDLTRPPERLDSPSAPAPAQSPPVSASSSLGYTARQRTRPPLSNQSQGDAKSGGPGGPIPVVEEVQETDEDAQKVVELLKTLETAEEVMAIVQVSLKIQNIRWTS